MKFTLDWLKSHLDTDASLTEITDKLTAIGLELEGIENTADKLRDFRVAKVIEAGPHPNADKLQLLKVDDGSSEPWQVVCGAPNARTGMVGVFGPPGTYIPGSDFTLKPAKIRDVESFGMMCSARELELGDEHDGIIELDDSAASAVGSSFADYAGLDDPVIDVSVTPNKQDCMGVRGIARDLAASGIGALKPLEQVAVERSGTGPDVRTDDPEGCPAFYACTIKGVSNGSAPDWMQRHLNAVGQKPISALVDITNYVMLDLGRPLHVYDMAKLNGPLVARKAKDGETLTALNDKEYTLDSTMTVIADDNGAHDIGGIMGGAATGAEEGTTDVLIECAYFTPENIARTGQKLMLTSDARQRFERGVDPAFLDDGVEIATAYVTRICGGTASEISRAGTPPTDIREIAYDPALCMGLGGIAVEEDRQKAILEALGFGVSMGAPWAISIPTWRRDVISAPDIVEEIVRMVGLDEIKSEPLPRTPGVASPTASLMQLAERRVRRAAASRGLNEAANWSFISEKEAIPFGSGDWTLANPISEDMKIMRPSMLPGLLSATKRNLDRGATSIRLFEVGRRYFKAKNGHSDEKQTVGLVLSGDKTSRGWQGGKAVRFDPYDIKGEVIALLKAAGAPTDKLMDFGEAGAHFHPGQSGTLRLGPKKILAAYGTLHPKTAKAYGLKGAIMGAEIFLDAIPMKPLKDHMRDAYDPPALQAVTRDFAFVVDDNVAAGDLVRAVKGADKKVIVDARLFDVFTGEELGEGKKSLAIEVTLQPTDKSFTEEELQAISDKVVANAVKLGGELRG
ncbi:phenylalanine--tRNA ligase subunit beta [Sphingorhabdus sp. Alg239-R122]|uniref:phenylalanine--tRNA ligase subunit beta n=1 Tax=Sphingorhabdus sp. Alg239-R122 TaxID=2305989 RepID=UPI0013DAFA88|nr:phenylalanine--tRNA ligase subunit beta [Sphingorhabdus sp. Alg239-R122]